MDAAAAIALEDGAHRVSVATVATRAGLSRTSFYEYFSSSSEIVAELISEELDSFSQFLSEKIQGTTDPRQAISIWVTSSLEYVADGRHLLAKALSAIEISRDQSASIAMAHRKMIASLAQPVTDLGIADVGQALSLIHSATQSATARIESGSDCAREIENTRNFIVAGISTLSQS
jgi:AcrR family transcriptional regulator